MNVVGNRSGLHYAQAYLPSLAQSNLEKQYQSSAESQRRESLRTYGATRRGPEARLMAEKPAPLPPARARCPLPRVLSNCCSYPAISYRCPYGSSRPCVQGSFQGAYLAYSVDYRNRWRESKEVSATLYQGTPYTSFVKRVGGGAPKQFNQDFM